MKYTLFFYNSYILCHVLGEIKRGIISEKFNKNNDKMIKMIFYRNDSKNYNKNETI
jgi:hypothetical protein